MKLQILTSFLLAFQMSIAFVPENNKNWKKLNHKTCGHAIYERIIGGNEAALGEFPWLIQLGRDKVQNGMKKKQFICGGSLITELNVLTAAHCIRENGVSKNLKYVKAGEYDTTTDPDCDTNACAPAYQLRVVDKAIVHPDYNKPAAFHNDVGIVTVDKPFKMNRFVVPICLLPSSLMQKTFIGEDAVVAGWGATEIVNFKTSDKLLKVTLPVLPNSVCSKAFWQLSIASSQMCAGGVKGKDSCNGDSGGPLMKIFPTKSSPKTYILGVVSIGPLDCGRRPVPALYSRVSSFEEWILNNLKF